MGDDGHPRVWELVRGVRGPPGGTDKDGGRTIWVAWFHSKSLSAAETLHSFYKFPFAFADKLFVLHYTWRQKGRRKLSLRNTSALSKVIRAKLVGGLIKVFAVTVGEGEKSFLSVFS